MVKEKYTQPQIVSKCLVTYGFNIYIFQKIYSGIPGVFTNCTLLKIFVVHFFALRLLKYFIGEQVTFNTSDLYSRTSVP